MMIKLVNFSDAHFHKFRNYAKDVEFEGKLLNSRLVNQLNALKQIHKHCLDNKIKLITFSGDLFHVRGRIDVEVFNEVHKQFKKIIDSGIEIVMIPGNHDASNKFSNYSIETFKEFGVKILYNGYHIINDFWSVKGVGYHKDMMDKIKEGKGKLKNCVLLCHLVVEGSRGINGYEFDSEVSLKDLRKYDLVFAGHIHKKQQLTDSVLVPGSFVANDWGDANGEHGFHEASLHDDGTFEVSFIETDAMKFNSYTINSNDDLKGLSRSGKDMTRLVVTDKSVNMEGFDDCIIEYDIKKDYVSRFKEEKGKDMDYIKQYVDIKSVEHKNLNKKKLMDIGRDLLKMVAE